jgi:hypothetical protein
MPDADDTDCMEARMSLSNGSGLPKNDSLAICVPPWRGKNVALPLGGLTAPSVDASE